MPPCNRHACNRHALAVGIGLLLVVSFTARAQISAPDIPEEILTNPAFERLLDEESENSDGLTDMLEQLEQRLQRPLILERATLRDIAALPFLTRDEARGIHAIARDRALAGDGRAVASRDHEAWRRIDSVLASDIDRLALLRACARLRAHEDATPGYAVALRTRLQQEDTPRTGFLDGRYPGSRARLQHRLRTDVGRHFSAALLAEKDPGETNHTDHLAGYVELRDLGMLRRAVAGDFTVTAGQGLVYWQQFGLAKGGEAVGVGRTPALLSPRASATEGFGARGAGIHLGGEVADVMLFYSSRGRDATIDDATGMAGAFSIDGLHRTPSERARRASVHEQMAGAHAALRLPLLRGSVHVGTSLQGARYSSPTDSRAPFGFDGNEAWVLGSDLSWMADGVLVFSEVAWAHTHVPAFLAGVEARINARASIAVFLRRYHERFVSLQGGAFGERGEPANEEGAYLGLRLRPVDRLRLNAWMDIYHFPNRTYFVHLPSSGVEAMLSAEYGFDRATQLRARLARTSKDQTAAARSETGQDIRPIVRRTQSSFRIEISHETTRGARLRLRAEYVRTAFDAWLAGGDGVLLSADLRLRPLPGLTLLGRLTAYGTEGYDARLYQFEHDVRGVMQNLVLYGDGLRAYLFAQWRPWHGVEIGLRYAVTIKDGIASMGEGPDTIEGDRLGAVSAQLDVEF
ncbi:MAG: hypothetical protein RBU27_04865 [Bacteroidota bacterium]|nr:hypothetical protein [Bacteroidota bacterium]